MSRVFVTQTYHFLLTGLELINIIFIFAPKQ